MAVLDTTIRWQIADFINDAPGDAIPEWKFCGPGFTQLDESPNAQTDTTAYISDRSATTITTSYQGEFAFSIDLITSEPSIISIYKIGRNQLTGSAAQVEYVRVESFWPSDEISVFPARKFLVTVVVSDISGPGAEKITMSGTLNQMGDFTDGTFNIDTKEFIPGESDLSVSGLLGGKPNGY
ncbi:MAG: hypothetical protein FWC41_01555 [Firmicutes bacterium]|nr:hypothetical protein [Bacillota bacterium]